MKTSKKFLAMLLCLLLAGSAVSCGESETGDDPDTSGDTITDSANDDDRIPSGVPAGTTFDGKTVRILNGQYFEIYLNLVNADEYTGDTVNDAVYARNLAVMDKLDVTFEYTDVVNAMTAGSSKTMDMIRQSVMAGDQEWDIIHDVEFFMAQMPGNDLLYEITDAPYIDIEKPWWTADYIKKANVNPEKIHFLSGDFSVGAVNQLGCMYYNKSLYEDYYGDPDALYDTVLSGNWTLDELNKRMTGVWQDLNGDNAIDFGDVVGLARGAVHYGNSHSFYSAGGSVVRYDEDSMPYIDGMSDVNVGITEKFYSLLYENASVCLKIPDAPESDYIIEKKFAGGTMLFMQNLLCGTDHLREMEDSYGIIPYPKYDESIPDYKALAHSQTACFAIPAVTTTEDMACAVMEAMAHEGHYTMVPEYYSVALKTKYVRDSDNDKALQIIDMIRNGATTDLGFLLSNKLNRIGVVLHDCIRAGHANYASTYAAAEPAAKNLLAEMLEK